MSNIEYRMLNFEGAEKITSIYHLDAMRALEEEKKIGEIVKRV